MLHVITRHALNKIQSGFFVLFLFLFFFFLRKLPLKSSVKLKGSSS